MKILFAASEVYPLAKTGGLGDVVSALTNELSLMGHDVSLVLPGYQPLIDNLVVESVHRPAVPFERIADYDLLAGRLPGIAARVLLVRSDRLFQPDDGLYGGRQFSVFLRFLVLSHAAAAIAADQFDLNWSPDILHANDWHTGLAFNFLDSMGNHEVARVFTIHNIAFSGRFPLSYWRLIDDSCDSLKGTLNRLDNEFSFLEEALIRADKINTVSPTYAKELCTRELGFGFEKLLRSRRSDLSGILNGVDYKVWHPEQDPHLPNTELGFSENEKASLKQNAQHLANLPADAGKILCTFTNRLTHQKMIDVVIDAIHSGALSDFQFIFHGQGDTDYENAVRSIAHLSNVSYLPGFSEATEHQLLAGADICLSPSRFEPCGLNALYAMRYGAVPVVRATGGYCDTVKDLFKANPTEIGNGFVLPASSSAALISTLHRIQSFYRQSTVWQAIVERIKNMHFAWSDSATQYLTLYDLARRQRNKSRETVPAAAALAALELQLMAS